MANVSPENVRTPAGSDAYNLTADLRLMGESIRGLVAVASTTDRAARVSSMESAGRPVTAANPLLVFRADAPTGAEVEISKDGTTWRTIGVETGATITTFGPGWSATSGSGHTPRVRRDGNMVYLFGSVSMGSGASMNDILAIPSGFTPSNTNTTFIGVTSLNPNGGTAGTRELAIANGRILAPAGYGAGSPAVGGTIPLGGCFWTVD